MQSQNTDTPRPLDSDHARFLKTRYFGSLDGLRCFSILMVIAFHIGLTQLRVGEWGDRGVQLFFAISGFLITTLLLRESTESGGISLKNFYVRRSLRIFPLYYAVLLMYVVLVLATERHAPEGALFFRNLKYFLTYTSNWFMEKSLNRVHFWLSWSLATEEQFYLVWPVVVFLAGVRSRVPLLFITAMMIFGEAMKYLIGHQMVNLGHGGNAMATSIATPICMGCILAYALNSPRSFGAARAVLGQWWSAPAALLALIVAIWFSGRIPEFFLYLAMVALLGTVVIRERHFLTPVLSNPVVRYIGTISYGMYLLHMLARGFAGKLVGGRPVAHFLATLLLTVVAASISYRFYETPFLKLKSRFSKSRRGAGESVPAAVVVRAADLPRPAAAPAVISATTPVTISAAASDLARA